MTDKPGKRTGQQGREEVAAMSDADLAAAASQYGVSTTNDDGTPRAREEIVNEVANKIRQAERQAAKAEPSGPAPAPST